MQRGGVIAGACLGVALVACAPPGARAPLVDGTVADAARNAGALDAAIRGRELYVTTCTDCHGAVRPSSVSQARWEKVLPRMVRYAGIDANAEADLRAYIAAALAAPASLPSTK